MRKPVVLIALVGVLSCSSESSTPARPSSPPAPAPAPQPQIGWSVAGTVVDTVGRQAVGGATITPAWGLATVNTGAD